MAAEVIDGLEIASEVGAELARDLDEFAAAHGRRPGIATLLVGDDFGSRVYRAAVEKLCAGLGLGYRGESLPPGATQADVVAVVETLNEDTAVSGILPLRPFPWQISESIVIEAIRADKDIDCFHPLNMGCLAMGQPSLPPATPAACIEVLERYLRRQGRDVADALEGAEVCVVGHSNTVGKPLALLLLNRNATVTVSHVFTFNRGNLEKHTRAADYLVVAAGVPHLIGPSAVKEGAVILDVGINRVVVCPECASLQRDKKHACTGCGADLCECSETIVGDVDFDAVADKAAAITPVPGGIGAVTNMMLARNALTAAKMQLQAATRQGGIRS